MPDSPRTRIGFENQNVQTSTPSTGVSHVLARTTKGNFNDPSQVVSNLAQFKSLFGSEIVPDGSISNIEQALLGGSKLRICRVPGEGIAKAVAVSAVYDPADGVITTDDGEVIVGEIGDAFTVWLIQPSTNPSPITLKFSIAVRTKEYTSYPNKLFRVKMAANGYLTLELYGNIYRYTDVNATNLIESIPLFLCKTSLVGNKHIISDVDFTRVKNLLDNTLSDNLEFVLDLVHTSKITHNPSGDVDEPISSNTEFLSLLNSLQPTFKKGEFQAGYTDDNEAGPVFGADGLIYMFDGGSIGTEPTSASWLKSMDYLRDYNEAYQISCSHLHQHLTPAEALVVHKGFADFVNDAQEVVYYIDIPKYNTLGKACTYLELIEWVSGVILVIGYSQYVAYFGGGWKYYNNRGVLKDCDNLGTVLGLGDSSASSFGPWFHFSGSNRGIVNRSIGPVSPNYGAPSNYAKINALAKSYVNISVIKDTRTQGKQAMLYHNFTSQLLDNSNKYLGITRLNLYLKKTLRPILDSYIEEPNTFPTWKSLFYKVKPELDKLVGSAYTTYEWMGDQFATSYADLEINTEANVRLGKYSAKLRYEDIIAMQEINLLISIDQVTGQTSVELVNK